MGEREREPEPAWVADIRRRHTPWTTSNPPRTICLLDHQGWPCEATRLIWQAWGGDEGYLEVSCLAQQLHEVQGQRDTLERVLRAVRAYAGIWEAEAAARRQQAGHEAKLQATYEVARRTTREAAALERAVRDVEAAVGLASDGLSPAVPTLLE